MTKIFTFSVPGLAIPQPRPRVTSKGVYYPKRARGSKRMSYEGYKELILTSYIERKPWLDLPDGWTHHRLFSLEVKVFLSPKALGDADKLLATFMDALQPLIWENDRQVKHAVIDVINSKESPHAEITIREME